MRKGPLLFAAAVALVMMACNTGSSRELPEEGRHVLFHALGSDSTPDLFVASPGTGSGYRWRPRDRTGELKKLDARVTEAGSRTPVDTQRRGLLADRAEALREKHPEIRWARWLYGPGDRWLVAWGVGAGESLIYRVGENRSTEVFRGNGGVDNPMISPDGRWLFFDLERWQTGLAVLTHQLRLASGALGESGSSDSPSAPRVPIVGMIPGETQRILKAEYAPDGRHIAVLVGNGNPRTGVDALWVIRTGDGSPRLLIPPDGVPDEMWQRDSSSRRVYAAYAGVSSFLWERDGRALLAVAALENACDTKSVLSWSLVPHREVEIRCRFSLYRADLEDSRPERVGSFETPPIPHGGGNLYWVP